MHGKEAMPAFTEKQPGGRKEVCVNQTEMEVALAEHWKEIGSLKHRVSDVERIVEAVHSLALEMAHQTEEIKHMNESIKQLNTDVAELKEKPAKRWDYLINALIGAAAGAVVACIL